MIAHVCVRARARACECVRVEQLGLLLSDWLAGKAPGREKKLATPLSIVVRRGWRPCAGAGKAPMSAATTAYGSSKAASPRDDETGRITDDGRITADGRGPAGTGGGSMAVTAPSVSMGVTQPKGQAT